MTAIDLLHSDAVFAGAIRTWEQQRLCSFALVDYLIEQEQEQLAEAVRWVVSQPLRRGTTLSRGKKQGICPNESGHWFRETTEGKARWYDDVPSELFEVLCEVYKRYDGKGYSRYSFKIAVCLLLDSVVLWQGSESRLAVEEAPFRR